MALARLGNKRAPREVLAAARTYYVRTDGSDSNDGLANTSGRAFLTIQKALNVISALDFNKFTVTVQIADGTYTGGNIIPVTVGQALTTDLIIQGNSGTPANVIISTTSVDAITTVAGSRALIKDIEIRTTTGGYSLYAKGVGAELRYSNIRFGACAAVQIIASGGGSVVCAGDYSIVGGALAHFYADSGGVVECGSKTITITGTPAFSSAFVISSQAVARIFLNTFVGSATGKRFEVQLNGSIQTFGGGINALPGNAAGTLASGGAYDLLIGAENIKFPATQVASSDPNVLDDYEEGSTTPTVTATSGTFTSVSCTLAYTKVGRSVLISGAVTIVTVGTAAGQIKVPLPFMPGANGMLACQEGQATGLMGSGFIASGDQNIYILKYDGATLAGSGRTIYFGGVYFV